MMGFVEIDHFCFEDKTSKTFGRFLDEKFFYFKTPDSNVWELPL